MQGQLCYDGQPAHRLGPGKAKQFRSWEFDSEGGFGEGKWGGDGDRWVIKHTGVRPEGMTVSATNTMLRERPDLVRWTSTDRFIGHETVPHEQNYAIVRVPPPPEFPAATPAYPRPETEEPTMMRAPGPGAGGILAHLCPAGRPRLAGFGGGGSAVAGRRRRLPRRRRRWHGGGGFRGGYGGGMRGRFGNYGGHSAATTAAGILLRTPSSAHRTATAGPWAMARAWATEVGVRRGHAGGRLDCGGARPGRSIRRPGRRQEAPAAMPWAAIAGRRLGGGTAGRPFTGRPGSGRMDSTPTAAITRAGSTATGMGTTSRLGLAQPVLGRMGLGPGPGHGAGLGAVLLGLRLGALRDGLHAVLQPLLHRLIRRQSAAVAAPYDYSQPIDTSRAPADDAVTDPAMALFDAGRDSFKQGTTPTPCSKPTRPGEAAQRHGPARIPGALPLRPEALRRGRRDPLRGALGRTRLGLDHADQPLSRRRTYTTQLRALEDYCRAHKNSASARFVLAYHYLTQGHIEAAASMLKTWSR